MWFSVPKTIGRDLESMDRLFELPWYRIGRHGYQDAKMRDQVVGEKMGVTDRQTTWPAMERLEMSGRV